MRKFVVLIVGLVVLLGLALVFPVVDWLRVAVEWIQANPSYSWPLFVVLYATATVLMLPGSVLTLAAGYVFGLSTGFVIISISSVLGATLAFLTGRYFARDWVLSKLQGIPRFRALDAAIGQHGALVVFLTRLSPIFPFNLLNYALGLTQVRLLTYVLVSWVGMMPGTLLYVYLGQAGSDLTALFSGQIGDSEYGALLFYFGLAASLLLVIAIARYSGRLLEAQLASQEAADSVDSKPTPPSEQTGGGS